MENGILNVPNDPVVHFIEGDGIGIDITPVMINVVDASVEKAYNGEKKIHNQLNSKNPFKPISIKIIMVTKPIMYKLNVIFYYCS